MKTLNPVAIAVPLASLSIALLSATTTASSEDSTMTPPITYGGNILALSMQGYSRWKSMLNIANELKTFGYKTTFVFPDDPSIARIKQEFEVDIIISDGMTRFDESMKDIFESLLKYYGTKGKTTPLSVMLNFGKYCPFVAGDTRLMQTLEKRHFDIVIIDTIFVTPCISVIPYKLSVPFVQYGNVFEVQHLRSLIHPSVYPVTKLLPLTDRMTYIERMGNTLLYLAMLTLPDLFNPTDIVGTFAPEKPHLTNEELKAKTELYLLETDELLDYHLPTYPNMIFVGGAATNAAAPLTGQLQLFLDSAVNGAVLVTFGSHIETLPDDIMNKIMKTFKMRQTLKFILKYDFDKTQFDKNILTIPWLPQNDILAHQNTKLFISHCGNNAQFEALYNAVPIICLPIFGDQYFNAHRSDQKGYGLTLNIAEFTVETLGLAINEILNNQSYKQHISKASKIFKSRPMPPAKRAAWWIDHVIRYGGQHLHPTVVDLPYYQFLLLDLIAGLICIFVLVGLVCCALYMYIRRCVYGRVKRKLE